MKRMGKKGLSLNDLPNIALVFVLIGVFFAIGLVILASLKANPTVADNVEANAAVGATITALAEIPSNWLLLIAVVIAAAIVIGIVVMYLGKGMGGSR